MTARPAMMVLIHAQNTNRIPAVSRSLCVIAETLDPSGPAGMHLYSSRILSGCGV